MHHPRSPRDSSLKNLSSPDGFCGSPDIYVRKVHQGAPPPQSARSSPGTPRPTARTASPSTTRARRRACRWRPGRLRSEASPGCKSWTSGFRYGPGGLGTSLATDVNPGIQALRTAEPASELPSLRTLVLVCLLLLLILLTPHPQRC